MSYVRFCHQSDIGLATRVLFVFLWAVTLSLHRNVDVIFLVYITCLRRMLIDWSWDSKLVLSESGTKNCDSNNKWWTFTQASNVRYNVTGKNKIWSFSIIEWINKTKNKSDFSTWGRKDFAFGTHIPFRLFYAKQSQDRLGNIGEHLVLLFRNGIYLVVFRLNHRLILCDKMSFHFHVIRLIWATIRP